jgi:hypothetical protein
VTSRGSSSAIALPEFTDEVRHGFLMRGPGWTIYGYRVYTGPRSLTIATALTGCSTLTPRPSTGIYERDTPCSCRNTGS